MNAPRPIVELARLNSRLFDACLLGVDDHIARRRTNNRTNNIVFLALHMVDARFYLARYVGHEDAINPFGQLLEDIDTIDRMKAFPPIDDVRSVWHDAATLLVDALEQAPEERWSEKSEVSFPIDDDTILGGVGFLLHHESYHIGQLALLRKHFGLPAMKYA